LAKSKSEKPYGIIYFKIPVIERDRRIILQFFAKFAIFFIGNIKDVNEAKNIWKKLCYNYKRILLRESKKSGSPGMKKNKWPYHEMMAFTKEALHRE